MRNGGSFSSALGEGEGPPTLVRIDDVSPGEDCPEGGFMVHTGLDEDRSGVFNDREIGSTELVCSPVAVDPELLMRTAEEPSGENCEFGGTVVRSGLDLDGELSAEETSSTTFVCADEPPPPEPPILVRYVVEDPGPNCLGGGVAVRSGPDLDGDGELSDDEVAETNFVCERAIVGDITVSDPAGLELLREIEVISGTLSIHRFDGTGVRLPSLVHVGGSLQIDGRVSTNTLEVVALPALTRIVGTLEIRTSPTLAEVLLPSLERAGEIRMAAFRELEALTTVELPALVAVDGTLEVNPGSMQTLEFPALEECGGRISIGGEAIERIALPRLREAGSFAVGFGTPVTVLATRRNRCVPREGRDT